MRDWEAHYQNTQRQRYRYNRGTGKSGCHCLSAADSDTNIYEGGYEPLNVSAFAIPGQVGEVEPQLLLYIVVTSIVNGKKASILLDPGVTTLFVSTSFAHIYKLPLFPLNYSRTLAWANSKSASNRVFYKTILDMAIGSADCQYYKQLIAYIADLQYDVIFGRPWFAKHDP